MDLMPGWSAGDGSSLGDGSSAGDSSSAGDGPSAGDGSGAGDGPSAGDGPTAGDGSSHRSALASWLLHSPVDPTWGQCRFATTLLCGGASMRLTLQVPIDSRCARALSASLGPPVLQEVDDLLRSLAALLPCLQQLQLLDAHVAAGLHCHGQPCTTSWVRKGEQQTQPEQDAR